MHPYSKKSHYDKYAGLFTSDYAINTTSSCVLVFHCHHQSCYWRRFLPKSTLYGWLWGMGFDVTQSAQHMEQSLFTIKTNMPIPVLVYGDAFQWEKYDHHILPSNLDLTSHNKAGLHWTFSELPHWVPLHRFRWKSTTIKSRSYTPKQSWSPSNFLEVPYWVPLHRFLYWVPLHRCRWKSIFHLESSYSFQAGSPLINIVWGTIRTAN